MFSRLCDCSCIYQKTLPASAFKTNKNKLFYFKKYLKITNKEFDEILYWYLFHIDIETSQGGLMKIIMVIIMMNNKARFEYSKDYQTSTIKSNTKSSNNSNYDTVITRKNVYNSNNKTSIITIVIVIKMIDS